MAIDTVLKHDKNHRPITCADCGITLFQAYVDDETLAANEVAHIDEMNDSDIRRDAAAFTPSVWIEGRCSPCNGPDDGDSRDR